MMNRKRKKSGEFVDIYLETSGKQYLKGKMDAEKDRLFLILCCLVVTVGGN